ncbi:MAG: hypothetical protein PHD95_00130 [Candidatus ainarchaeum sp.]|nr:hypothetical protein [Candidatus ainarchaeum sp.]
MKIVRIKLSPEAEEVYNYLNKEAEHSKIEKTILAAVGRKVELIKANIHYGEPINKHLIPKEYKEKYGIKNLFWVGLPNYWRMFYALTEGETQIEIIAFVLDILSHDKYNKKFGYKEK